MIEETMGNKSKPQLVGREKTSMREGSTTMAVGRASKEEERAPTNLGLGGEIAILERSIAFFQLSPID